MFTNHHRICERLHNKEWIELTQEGVLHFKLLVILWEEYMNHSHTLISLMTKFGLLVPLRSDCGEVTQFIVPTLLPRARMDDPSIVQWSTAACSSCYFVFTLDEELCSNAIVSESDLKKVGHLPRGTFERIVGKALSWSQRTAKASTLNLQSVILHQDNAVLSFGMQRFRLVLCNDIHCVRIDIEGEHPLAVHQKIMDFIRSIINEFMKCLCFFPAILFPSTTACSKHSADVLSTDFSPSDMLIPLVQLRKAARGESVLTLRGGRPLMSMDDIKRNYWPWLVLYSLRPNYDVFVSYRWGNNDSEFTQALFDMFTNFTIGTNNSD